MICKTKYHHHMLQCKPKLFSTWPDKCPARRKIRRDIFCIGRTYSCVTETWCRFSILKKKSAFCVFLLYFLHTKYLLSMQMSFILQKDETFFTFQFSVITGQRCLVSWSSSQDILLFCQTCSGGL